LDARSEPAPPEARTIVKVCGLTRVEDARVALSAGADWLGFIVNGESPRAIEPARARDILATLGGAVGVAVLVSVGPDEALAIAERIGAARVQLHRVDSLAWPADFPIPAAFAVPVHEDGALAEALPSLAHLVLLDTAHPALAGGSGHTFPWETARIVALARPVLIAGGLDGGNVAEAIAQVRPYGVDASSRLERAPGAKEPEKVRRFVPLLERREGRIPVSCRVEFRARSGSYAAYTRDLSTHGLFLKSPRPFALGTRLQMTIHLPSRRGEQGLVKPAPLELEGEVRRSLRPGPGSHLLPGVGVRFVNPPAEVLRVIEEFIATRRKG
jgi:phosphoribosylanthranilate isomerase